MTGAGMRGLGWWMRRVHHRTVAFGLYCCLGGVRNWNLLIVRCGWAFLRDVKWWSGMVIGIDIVLFFLYFYIFFPSFFLLELVVRDHACILGRWGIISGSPAGIYCTLSQLLGSSDISWCWVRCLRNRVYIFTGYRQSVPLSASDNCYRNPRVLLMDFFSSCVSSHHKFPLRSGTHSHEIRFTPYIYPSRATQHSGDRLFCSVVTGASLSIDGSCKKHLMGYVCVQHDTDTAYSGG